MKCKEIGKCITSIFNYITIISKIGHDICFYVKNNDVLTEMTVVIRCRPLFVRNAPASPTVFSLNLTFSLVNLQFQPIHHT